MLQNARPRSISKKSEDGTELTRLLPRELPGLFVFNTCEQFIRTVPVLPRDEKDLDDVNTEAEDHVADECRYFIRGVKQVASQGVTAGMV
jgi:hypothetical protein